MIYPDIYVLRHGETVWNLEGRIQGHKNSPLTDKGIAQARMQGAVLKRLGLANMPACVSPQGRAVQTAELALGVPASELSTDARLQEIGAGHWEGRMHKELQTEHPALFELDGVFDWIGHAPGGEGFLALERRCTDFLNSLSQPTIIVTHGITSRMLRSIALGEGAALLSELPGGQGNVHAVLTGKHHVFDPEKGR